MKRSTFLKSLIAAPAAIAGAKIEAEPSLPLGLNTKKIVIEFEPNNVRGGYLVPPELADALKEAMSKYPV